MINYIKKYINYNNLINYNFLKKNIKDLEIIEEKKDIEEILINIKEDDILINNLNDRQFQINILILIKIYTNTYYKYSNNEKFNNKLYNIFINNEFIISYLTEYNNDKINIFDKYIIEYNIKKKHIINYLKSKNKIINFKNNFDSLNDINSSNNYIDVLFILDMSIKDIFLYCYFLLNKDKDIINIKNILLSIVIKYNNQEIRLKVDSFIAKTTFINF
jgi:hypothetical protein